VALSPQALDLIRRILGGDLAGALDEPPGRATHEVEILASHALEHHLERRLRALRMLERT
jgi:DNA repair protein RecO (recombination protein O)